MSSQKGNFLVVIAVVLLLIVVGGTSYYLGTQRTQETVPAPTSEQRTYSPPPVVMAPVEINGANDSEARFTGIINESYQDCNGDGVCKILVDKKWVIIDAGGDPTPEMAAKRGPRGKIIVKDVTYPMMGSIGGQEVIGKQVEVFVRRTGDSTFSLYGNENYYIKLLD